MPDNTLYFAVFNSAHRVMKAEAVLKRSGLQLMLVPAPRALATDCGLAIRYAVTIHDLVLKTLRSGETMPEIIFRQIDQTHYEPIWKAETEPGPPE